MRALAIHEVIAEGLAENVASAVGLRNLLVRRYADIDDRRVLEHLGQLDRFREFVVAVARWVEAQS